MTTTHWWTTRTDPDLARDATDLFRDTFGDGAVCEGVWAAPGRVNLIGEHVDYAGGMSLPFALPQCTAAAVGRRDDGILRLVSVMPGTGEASLSEVRLAEVGPGTPVGWVGYAAGAVWAGLEDGVIPSCSGLDIALVSDVPVGAGLSSSAALECSVALAAFELATGTSPDGDATARLVAACMRAENEVVGASTGGLDQRSSFYGAAGRALAVDFLHDTVEPVDCDLDAAGLALLITDTNAPHRLVDGQYASRRGVIDAVGAAAGEGTVGAYLEKHPGDAGVRSLENIVRDWACSGDAAELIPGDGEIRTATALRRVRHVVEEIGRTRGLVEETLRGHGDLTPARAAVLGERMNSSHGSLRDLFEVTVPELDSAQSAAVHAGALGARMTGGGFGGSVISLVTADRVRETASAVATAAAGQGLPEPTFFTAVPSAGARRLS